MTLLIAWLLLDLTHAATGWYVAAVVLWVLHILFHGGKS